MAEKDLNEETVIQEDEAVVTEEESGKDNDNKSSDNTEAAGETQQNEENVNADADAEETTKEGETEAETEESDEAAEGKEKKKLFKKKEKKDKKDEKIEALTDQVKRQMAEFDNFRKRTEKEKSSMYEMGAKSVIEKILPVIDNFERGLDTVPADEADSPFTEGMRMIYKQLMTELDNIGVKPIEALGAEFNPDFHNAVMQVESEEYESGHVAQEMQKGYMYRDSVVRHSMVAVVP
ncbi:MAG: nucleotide exchange factor GrpE [Lachnospiraceae bacterium]|nr:nucleotide exchange factor GrpE [Lachnospiraceae bacterium]